MDTQQYMEEMVSRQQGSSPHKVADPQIELLIQMGREADLSSRPAQLQKQTEEQGEADSPRDNADPVSPTAESTPEAVPQIPEPVEPPSVVAAVPSVEQVSFPDASLPMGSAAAQAAPSEVFTSSAAEASPTVPIASQAGTATPSEPVNSSTESAEPSQPQISATPAASPLFSQEQSAGQVKIDITNSSLTETVVPDALPVDFEAALKMARNTIELPRFTAGDPQLLEIMDTLPELPDPETWPSTVFAEQKLAGMSQTLRQWGRYT